MACYVQDFWVSGWYSWSRWMVILSSISQHWLIHWSSYSIYDFSRYTDNNFYSTVYSNAFNTIFFYKNKLTYLVVATRPIYVDIRLYDSTGWGVPFLRNGLLQCQNRNRIWKNVWVKLWWLLRHVIHGRTKRTEKDNSLRSCTEDDRLMVNKSKFTFALQRQVV